MGIQIEKFLQIIEAYPKMLWALYLIFVILYYSFIFIVRDPVINFFNLFENSTYILSIYYVKIIYLIYNPDFTQIGILLAFLLGILYLIVSIENQGHMIFIGKDRSAQQTQANFFILTIFNFALLVPFVLYLVFVKNQIFDIIVIFFVYVISTILALVFSQFANIMQNYERLDRFCQNFQMNNLDSSTRESITLFFFINEKQKYRNFVVIFMGLSFIFAYILSLNLITLIYMELNSVLWLFVILSLSFPGGPIKGPVNIFFKDGKIFNRVFIIEESSSGYINTLHKGNILKKVMTDSISFIEPSDIT